MYKITRVTLVKAVIDGIWDTLIGSGSDRGMCVWLEFILGQKINKKHHVAIINKRKGDNTRIWGKEWNETHSNNTKLLRWRFWEVDRIEIVEEVGIKARKYNRKDA